MIQSAENMSSSWKEYQSFSPLSFQIQFWRYLIFYFLDNKVKSLNEHSLSCPFFLNYTQRFYYQIQINHSFKTISTGRHCPMALSSPSWTNQPTVPQLIMLLCISRRSFCWSCLGSSSFTTNTIFTTFFILSHGFVPKVTGVQVNQKQMLKLQIILQGQSVSHRHQSDHSTL